MAAIKYCGFFPDIERIIYNKSISIIYLVHTQRQLNPMQLIRESKGE